MTICINWISLVTSKLINPNSHEKEREGSKNGSSPGYEPGSPAPQCTPLARHLGVAARAAISCPYDTYVYDVIGLGTFSSLPLVGLCMVRVNI